MSQVRDNWLYFLWPAGQKDLSLSIFRNYCNVLSILIISLGEHWPKEGQEWKMDLIPHASSKLVIITTR